MMKHTILFLTFLLAYFQLIAQNKEESNEYKLTHETLAPGAYDYSKVANHDHIRYYDRQADREWEKRLRKDKQLLTTKRFGEYQKQEDGTTIFFRELEALIYSPDLDFVYLWSGAGFGWAYDLKTLEETTSDYTSRRHSPTKKFRYTRVFASQSEAEYTHHIEILVNGEYIPHQFARSFGDEQFKGAYWHNENTFYYLYKQEYDSPYWIGHSIKVEKK